MRSRFAPDAERLLRVGKQFSLAQREVPTDHFEKEAPFGIAAGVEPKSQAGVKRNDGTSGFQPSIGVGEGLERLPNAEALLLERLPLTSKLVVRENLADTKTRQVVELPLDSVAGSLE